MIRTYLAAAAIAATPGLAVAELSFKGSAIVGAGNHGLASGAYGIITGSGTYQTTLDNGFEASASATLTGRSFRSEAEYLESDFLTFDLALDMGRFGKLSFGNQRPLAPNLPWADGTIFNFASSAVFPTTRLPFRRADDTFALVEDGQIKKTRPLTTLRYSNAHGPVSYQININPIDRFTGGFRKDDLIDEVPWIDAGISVQTGFGTYGFMANDLQDYELKAEYGIMPGTRLELMHDFRNTERKIKRNIAVLTYHRPQDAPGLFRGFRAGFYETPVLNSAVVGVTLGRRDWQVTLAADKAEGFDPNFAIEANYKITPKITLYGALDSGHALGEGRSPFLTPPASAPARGSAVEVALKIDF